MIIRKEIREESRPAEKPFTVLYSHNVLIQLEADGRYPCSIQIFQSSRSLTLSQRHRTVHQDTMQQLPPQNFQDRWA
jgi:hypothetical protein